MDNDEITIRINEIPLVVAIVNDIGDLVYWNKYLLENETFSKLKQTNINEFLKTFIENNEFFQKVEFIIEEKPVVISLTKTNLKDGRIVIFISPEAEINALKKQSTFISNLSREIKTPLNGILGSLSLLLETKLDKKQTGYIELLKQSSETLISIVNDILDYSRIEAGIFYLQNGPFKIRECIEEANEIIQVPVEDKNIKILTSINQNVPETIISDKRRLQQILVNLYHSSVKNSPQNGFIHTSIAYNEMQEYLEFYISDNSVGLDLASSELLLHNGYKENEGDKLKFSIINRMIKLFNGEINIVSNSKDGLVVYFKIKISVDNIKNKIVAIYDKNFNDRNMVFLNILENKGIPILFNAEDDIVHLMRQKTFDAVIFAYEKDDVENNKLLENIYKNTNIDKNKILLLLKSNEEKFKDDKLKQIMYKPIEREKLLSKLNEIFKK